MLGYLDTGHRTQNGDIGLIAPWGMCRHRTQDEGYRSDCSVDLCGHRTQDGGYIGLIAVRAERWYVGEGDNGHFLATGGRANSW